MSRGFTIIEITIVITLAALTLIIASTLFITEWQILGSETAKSELRSQNIAAQTEIARAVEESFEIVNSKIINSGSYASDSDTIILKLPSVDSDQDVIPETFDYEVFERDAADPAKLISDTEINVQSSRPSGKRTVAGFVGTLNFRYNNNVWSDVDFVEINIMNEENINGGLKNYKTFAAVKLKNK